MADESTQPAPDFLDQSEIDKLLAQATDTAEAKPILLRADGLRGDDLATAKVEAYDFRNPGFIGEADLAGYNSNRFDVPMLMEEFSRVGIEFEISKRRLIDVQRIFYKMEPRTLKAAYRLYCGKELEDAHDAMADVRATIDVFKGQLRTYEGKDLLDEDGNIIPAPIKNDMQALHTFTNDLNFLDATQKLRVQPDGKVVFNFGKYLGQSVKEVFAKDKNYYFWIVEKEFSSQVKQIVKEMMKAVSYTHLTLPTNREV